MFRLPPTAHRDSVLAMAATGGGWYGKTPKGWVTGRKRELAEAGATNIKKANVRVVRTYL